jgi:hypothetical protein
MQQLYGPHLEELVVGGAHVRVAPRAPRALPEEPLEQRHVALRAAVELVQKRRHHVVRVELVRASVHQRLDARLHEPADRVVTPGGALHVELV